jgi:hypothetical protein
MTPHSTAVILILSAVRTENTWNRFRYNFLFLVGWDWVHLVRRPLIGLLYQLRMTDDECGTVGGMRIGRVLLIIRRLLMSPSSGLSYTFVMEAAYHLEMLVTTNKGIRCPNTEYCNLELTRCSVSLRASLWRYACTYIYRSQRKAAVFLHLRLLLVCTIIPRQMRFADRGFGIRGLPIYIRSADPAFRFDISAVCNSCTQGKHPRHSHQEIHGCWEHGCSGIRYIILTSRLSLWCLCSDTIHTVRVFLLVSVHLDLVKEQ